MQSQTQNTTTVQQKSRQTHVSLRYIDLVSIDVFFGLLHRNWLESNLHHVCFGQCKTALSLVWFTKLLSFTEPDRLYSDGAASPPGLGDVRRASSLTRERCVGPEEKPPLCCQNKSEHTDRTFPRSHTLLLSTSLIHTLHILKILFAWLR